MDKWFPCTIWDFSSWVACFQIPNRAPRGVVVLQISELHNLGLWHLTLKRWYSSHVMSCQPHPPSLWVRCFSGVRFWLSIVATFNGGLCRASGAHLLRLFPCRSSGSAWFGLCSLICCWLNDDSFFVDCSIANLRLCLFIQCGIIWFSMVLTSIRSLL